MHRDKSAKMAKWLFFAKLPFWHFCPCASISKFFFCKMTFGWVLWKSYYTLLLKKCLRPCPGLSMYLSERINWIIPSFPWWILKILFVLDSWDHFGSLWCFNFISRQCDRHITVYLTMLKVLVSSNRPNSWIHSVRVGRWVDRHISRWNARSLITEKIPRGRIWFRCTRNRGWNSTNSDTRGGGDWGCNWRVNLLWGCGSNLKIK